MHCLITAGPTVELIDAVRRLTNHSTGRLGCGLADALARAGHRVTLLLSETAVHAPKAKKVRVLRFNTTKDLHEQLEAAAALRVKAVFHVAAVSDFTVKRPRKGFVDAGTETNGEINSLPAQMVSRCVFGRLEIRSRGRQKINRGRRPRPNQQMQNRRLRGQRPGVWGGVWGGGR